MANKDGVATIDLRIDGVSLLKGDNNIVGRAIVVHAGEDDLGKGGDEGSLKTGNAGGRVACCVIVESKEETSGTDKKDGTKADTIVLSSNKLATSIASIGMISFLLY